MYIYFNILLTTRRITDIYPEHIPSPRGYHFNTYIFSIFSEFVQTRTNPRTIMGFWYLE